MVRPAAIDDHEVVNLISDDEQNGPSDDQIEFFDAQSVGSSADVGAHFDYPGNLPEYRDATIGGRDVIDLTAVPDIDVRPSDIVPQVVGNVALVDDGDDIELISEAVCLQLVLDVFPDVSVDYVLTMISERTTDLTRTKEHSERIVNELLEEDTYPKEAENASKKRRRADSDDFGDFEKDEGTIGVLNYATDA